MIKLVSLAAAFYTSCSRADRTILIWHYRDGESTTLTCVFVEQNPSAAVSKLHHHYWEMLVYLKSHFP